MDWQTQLISVYLSVCNIFDQRGFSHYLERTRNNKTVVMTDQEVLTIYLFGMMSHRRTIKQIHSFAFDHFKDWFPNWIGYEAFVRRIDKMGEMLPAFLELLIDTECPPEIRSRIKLIDSMPIVLAGPKRSNPSHFWGGFKKKLGSNVHLKSDPTRA